MDEDDRGMLEVQEMVEARVETTQEGGGQKQRGKREAEEVDQGGKEGPVEEISRAGGGRVESSEGGTEPVENEREMRVPSYRGSRGDGGDDLEGRGKAFLEHNIICGPPPEKTEPIGTRRCQPRQEMMRAVRKALAKTRNLSVSGPDGDIWRLLKAVKDTRLGKAALEAVGQMSEVENRYYGEEDWRGMVMVMMPKPGKNHTKLKGWRPIVLLNTIGKLAEKMVAEKLMKEKSLFHERAFAGRKWRGAIDSVMLMDEIRKTVGEADVHQHGR